MITYYFSLLPRYLIFICSEVGQSLSLTLTLMASSTPLKVVKDGVRTRIILEARRVSQLISNNSSRSNPPHIIRVVVVVVVAVAVPAVVGVEKEVSSTMHGAATM